MLIKLVATAAHPEHPEGTLYEVAPVFAAADLYRKYAIEPEPGSHARYKQRVLSTEPDSLAELDADRRRIQLENLARARNARKYKRRDMEAED